MPDSAPPLLIAPPPPGWRGRVVADPDADRLARRSMTFGLLSFVVNPLLLCTIIGVTSGRRALRLGTSHRSMAITGIVSALVSIVVSVVVGVLVFVHSHDLALQRGLESSIARTAASQGATIADVTCPVPHDPGAGTTIVCSATSAGAPIRIQATFLTATTFRAELLRQG